MMFVPACQAHEHAALLGRHGERIRIRVRRWIEAPWWWYWLQHSWNMVLTRP